MTQQPHNIEQLMGPAEPRYFGEGFKGFDLRIKAIEIGTGKRTCPLFARSPYRLEHDLWGDQFCYDGTITEIL